ncbi:preprotein translocase subunit SecE [Candidatus Shapirobacteria bacterium CG06_land_8_20_14_3_00_40_12]|uniref:Protein translocase subunit SecE n=2 Tax=Candidatus Shapironibacteriota TaxID=1752721 RepID=A0A2M7TSR4_9BACT|nr:MAG: preprotein translocase subunit SecE [Candidatus Shapirobacteria bacterium CG06_land_8_20_14_3_00_40_12]PIZ58846.1 MAG: preprotein translocase subunit SecE [Candidatus Shapirobacteria bacterium CG_4_10_14_0_2_um_filter_40_12]
MNAVVNFFREVRAEFKNISWPKKDTLLELSIVVISISVIISLILGGFDFIFTQGIGLLGHQQNKGIQNNQGVSFPTISQSPTPTMGLSPTPIIKKTK